MALCQFAGFTKRPLDIRPTIRKAYDRLRSSDGNRHSTIEDAIELGGRTLSPVFDLVAGFVQNSIEGGLQFTVPGA